MGMNAITGAVAGFFLGWIFSMLLFVIPGINAPTSGGNMAIVLAGGIVGAIIGGIIGSRFPERRPNY